MREFTVTRTWRKVKAFTPGDAMIETQDTKHDECHAYVARHRKKPKLKKITKQIIDKTKSW